MTVDTEALDAVERYIRDHWDDTMRAGSDGGSHDELPLTHPFVVPTADPTFRELFYWDTFYACVGLALHERWEVVVGCADNFIELITTLGCVPNSTRRVHLNRSQPPHAWALFEMVHAHRQDRAWQTAAYHALVAEHAFWMAQRRSPNVLNRYGHHADPAGLAAFWERDELWVRFPDAPTDPTDKRLWLARTMAEAETGWDFNPRFDHRCDEHEAVDLNALLYGHESLCARWADELDLGEEAARWRRRAAGRRDRMDRWLWDQEAGLYRDHDFVKQRPSTVASVATFLPLWTGAASEVQAERIVGNLERFERAGGLACCEDGGRTHRQQWDYPNAWPPTQYYAIEGLRRYGYHDHAARLAAAYLDCVAGTFATTGELWEKYNAARGDAEVNDEYEMPPMLGWTAGVFLHCRRTLGR